MDVIAWLLTYFIFMNLLGFAMMGIDKYKAIKRAFRIPESTLFVVAVIGGNIGSILGMYTFRHKTRQRKFVYGLPIILILQIIIILVLISAPIEFTII